MFVKQCKKISQKGEQKMKWQKIEGKLIKSTQEVQHLTNRNYEKKGQIQQKIQAKE